MERRLAAILTADMVSYSRLMGADAVATVAPALYGFKRSRRTFTRSAAALHRH